VDTLPSPPGVILSEAKNPGDAPVHEHRVKFLPPCPLHSGRNLNQHPCAHDLRDSSAQNRPQNDADLSWWKRTRPASPGCPTSRRDVESDHRHHSNAPPL